MPNYNGVWSLSTQYQYNTDWQADNVSPARVAATIAARGLFHLGETANGNINIIEQINTVSEGNSTDFGDRTVAATAAGALASATRGVFAGGAANTDVVDFVTIASAGNATDFGNLAAAAQGTSGLSSATRGIFGGGYTNDESNTIQYITIANTGNTTDFGDLTQARYILSSCGSPTRGIFSGGLA